MDSADAAPRGYRIGYGRVSTRDQNPDSQRDALEAAGCDEVYIDKASGKLASRPEFDKALGRAPAGRHVRDHPAVSRDAVAEASHRPVRRPY
jgi:DNA invertase Pin-like site-specific DNA recombinase